MWQELRGWSFRRPLETSETIYRGNRKRRCTPEDMCDAITYDGGIKNTIVNYIKMNRNHDTFLNLNIAEKLRMIDRLGTPAEIKYERLSEGNYALHSYTYSGS